MGYEQENYRRIREEYQTKYLVAREAADRRRAEVAVAIPAVALIDAELQKTGLAIMKAATGESIPPESSKRPLPALRAGMPPAPFSCPA